MGSPPCAHLDLVRTTAREAAVALGRIEQPLLARFDDAQGD